METSQHAQFQHGNMFFDICTIQCHRVWLQVLLLFTTLDIRTVGMIASISCGAVIMNCPTRSSKHLHVLLQIQANTTTSVYFNRSMMWRAMSHGVQSTEKTTIMRSMMPLSTPARRKANQPTCGVLVRYNVNYKYIQTLKSYDDKRFRPLQKASERNVIW